MKKIIGIYVFYLGINEPYWDENSQDMGGSETWSINIANEFQKKGYHTIVFGNPSYWHFSNLGVEYVPKEFFENRCEYQHFDYFISSRTAWEISPYIDCDNIYIMSHEAIINGANTIEDLKLNKIKKIGVLSEWHKNMLLNNYNGLNEDRMFLTFNGVDKKLYDDVDINKKENMMVWSSCKERGLKYFIDAIFPCIKRFIPDFKLAICAYNNDIPDFYKIMDGIEIYGKLSKQELSDLQKKAKIWVYLNYGDDEETGFRCHETFCLSAVENAMAKNAIICSNASGLNTTLNGFSGFIGTDLNLDFNSVTRETRYFLKNQIIEQILKVMSDDEYRFTLVNEGYEICKKYTWENVANNWIAELKKNE